MDEVGAYVAPLRQCMVRMKRGTKPTAVAEHEERFEATKGDAWAGALEAFTRTLAQAPWSGARTRVVLADHWARYAIVPHVAALNSPAERLAHGRQLLTGLYGDAVADRGLRLSDSPPHPSPDLSSLPGPPT